MNERRRHCDHTERKLNSRGNSLCVICTRARNREYLKRKRTAEKAAKIPKPAPLPRDEWWRNDYEAELAKRRPDRERAGHFVMIDPPFGSEGMVRTG